MQERRKNIDRTQETRSALVGVARTLFFEKGYAATGTPEVVEMAGVTRGALYHHFKDKKALFKAVAEAEASNIAQEIEASSIDAANSADALLDGARAYFQAMRQPGRIRLLLIEGPAVLGPEDMRQIDLDTGGRELRIGLKEAMGTGVTAEEVDIYADLISAMFDRAALACNGQPDRKAYENVLAALLSSLTNTRSQP